ncbi:MAG: hypothetical protein QXY75_03405 [Candidatus Bathyarchaeia archaeon]|nr:hypothetical protein [Candidatus Bathyarchaeota archaeon]
MVDPSLKEEVQRWLTALNNDPIFKILLKNSNLTKVQAETFLIDILAEKIVDKKMTYEDKAKLRSLKSGVSRGSFNRTLAQARKNVIRSIYTVILLGYLGVFEDPRLDIYIEIANKIRAYSERYREIWEKGQIDEDQVKVLQTLQSEIEKSLLTLSKPKSLSKKL